MARRSLHSTCAVALASLLLSAPIAVGVTTIAPTVAQAGGSGPEQVFAGKVITSKKSFPTSAKSASAYVSAIRKISTTTFNEDKETQSWKVNFGAFLKAPLDDVEYVVKLYDLSTRPATLLTSFDQYSDQRGQRTIISNFTIDRKTAGVNKDISIVVESKGRKLASGKFHIAGEWEKFSGKVDFSDEDTKKSE